MLDFDNLRKVNVQRCEQALHPISSWSPSDWSNAMAGETGEACNLTKKMLRLWSAGAYDLSKMNIKEGERNMEDLVEKLGKEVADVIIYADLLLARVGLDLGEEVRKKFNEKSVELGLPHRL